jgi:hypothetical protein
MAKTKKKPSFNCDFNGGIMVVAALRYSLGRMTYVPGAVQDWIKTYWDSFDSNTRFVIVRDVFEYLYDDFKNGGKMQARFNGYDIREWEKFAIDRYWALSYDERKSIDMDLGSKNGNSKWLIVWMPKLYENHIKRKDLD